MATVNATFVNNSSERDTVRIVTWAAIANGNQGTPIELVDFADRCVQVTGTFGAGGTVILEGSNDGTNYVTLDNPQGTGLSFTAAGLKQVLELPRYVRPSVTAGDGTTSINAILCLRKVTRV